MEFGVQLAAKCGLKTTHTEYGEATYYDSRGQTTGLGWPAKSLRN